MIAKYGGTCSFSIAKMMHISLLVILFLNFDLFAKTHYSLGILISGLGMGYTLYIIYIPNQ